MVYSLVLRVRVMQIMKQFLRLVLAYVWKPVATYVVELSCGDKMGNLTLAYHRFYQVWLVRDGRNW